MLKIAVLLANLGESFFNVANLFPHIIRRVDQLNCDFILVFYFCRHIPQDIKNHTIAKPTDCRCRYNRKPKRLD
tara:strand:+ start:1563 stop:1784 length:222 start_codon:yes stop_codon:yes gene_type:complete